MTVPVPFCKACNVHILICMLTHKNACLLDSLTTRHKSTPKFHLVGWESCVNKYSIVCVLVIYQYGCVVKNFAFFPLLSTVSLILYCQHPFSLPPTQTSHSLNPSHNLYWYCLPSSPISPISFPIHSCKPLLFPPFTASATWGATWTLYHLCLSPWR